MEKLNNGKEINETNITELLTKAKEIWPTGMTWSEATTNNNWYGNPGTIAQNMMSTNGVYTSPNAGCGGFAVMVSDYLFGKTGNPAHVVTNFSDLRPGDIIVRLNADKTVDHVMIVVSRFDNERVFVAHGNYGDQVEWPKGTTKWYAISEPTSYIALSRWPA